MEVASWIQAGAAVAAFFLSLAVWKQSKRIKDLENISKALIAQTSELSNHTQIFQKRFDHEVALSLEQRMPLFEPSGIMMLKDETRYYLTLTNVGRKAFMITAENTGSANYDLQVPQDSCGTGGQLNVNIVYKDGFETKLTMPFSFNLHYYNKNEAYTQVVAQQAPGSDYVIDLPKPRKS
jgi:hypothetical protein